MTIKYIMLRPMVFVLQKTAALSAVACRLTQLTGKHPDRVHPKHLVRIREPWYLQYLNSPDIVLDVGCNNGQHTLKAAKRCKKIIGFDYDRHMLALARKEAIRTHASNAKFVHADAETTFPFADGVFDVVLFLDVYEHLNQREKSLTQILRVLKKGGMLCISIPQSDTSWKQFQRSVDLPYFSDPDHKVEFTQDQIIGELEAAGFAVQKVSPVTLDTPLVGFIDLIGGVWLSAYAAVSRWRRRRALLRPGESIGLEIVCKKI